MTTITTSFLPSRHGFRFVNDFRNPVGAFSTWGRCNGMSQTALDYFNANQPAPSITNVNFELPLQSSLCAAITAEHAVQLFATRTSSDGTTIVGRTLRGSDLGSWGTCVRGSTTLAPAATCWGPNRTDMLVVGNDSQLYIASFDGATLSDSRRDCNGGYLGFNLLGGKTLVQPAIASPHAGQLNVYYVNGDDASVSFRAYSTATAWADPVRLGGVVTSGCAAVANSAYSAAYARGGDHAMWTCESVSGGAHSWRSLGGLFTSGPAAASPGPGRVELYARGMDGCIWQNIRDGATWLGWNSLGAPSGGTKEEAPAAIAAYGLMEVFARSNDDRTWRRRWEGGAWHDWELVDAISDPANRLTSAIADRNFTSTLGPIIAAITFGLGVPLPAMTAGRYVIWPGRTDDETFRWSATEEIPKLIQSLSRGVPMALGLIAYEGFGHEVVAFGLESDSDLPPGSFPLPGDFRYHIRVYDPNHPNCDNNRISFDGRDLRRTIDARHPAISSSTGEKWRGFFVRDDYHAQTPPL